MRLFEIMCNIILPHIGSFIMAAAGEIRSPTQFSEETFQMGKYQMMS